MRDKENVLRILDEIDNMVMVLNSTVERGLKIDPTEARNRFYEMRRRLQYVIDRVSTS
jgi:hypothetical protein